MRSTVLDLLIDDLAAALRRAPSWLERLITAGQVTDQIATTLTGTTVITLATPAPRTIWWPVDADITLALSAGDILRSDDLPVAYLTPAAAAELTVTVASPTPVFMAASSETPEGVQVVDGPATLHPRVLIGPPSHARDLATADGGQDESAEVSIWLLGNGQGTPIADGDQTRPDSAYTPSQHIQYEWSTLAALIEDLADQGQLGLISWQLAASNQEPTFMPDPTMGLRGRYLSAATLSWEGGP